MKYKRIQILFLAAFLAAFLYLILKETGMEEAEAVIFEPCSYKLRVYMEEAGCTQPATGIERTRHYLEKGETGPLVGLSFGDALDYERFENIDNRYFLKEEKNEELAFFFEGRGLGFSGMMSYGSKNFLGIEIPIESGKLASLFGEPDTSRKDEQGNEHVYWEYEKAVLSAYVENNLVMYLEYHAREGIADRQEFSEQATELGQDRLEEGITEEAVYQWSAFGSKSSPDGSYAYFHPYDDGYDESLTDDFIKYYLMQQEIDKEIPDGVVYNQKGDPLIEYYMDSDKEQYCFIVHLWGDYWVDYEAGISKYQDAIYCTAQCLKEENRIGTLLHNWDEEGRSVRERQYDSWGKRTADLSYENQEGVPIPLVTSDWKLGGNHAPTDVLGSGQKFWFHKDRACFDETGKWIGLKDAVDWNDEKEYLPFESTCVYGLDNKLQTIWEERQEEDEERGWKEEADYSGQISFYYDKNGMPERAKYIRSSYTHGTFDDAGTIEYDKNGRMIYNEYYVTHGGHIELFLYEGDSKHPWACFYWCSFAPGFENIYLFRPVS